MSYPSDQGQPGPQQYGDQQQYGQQQYEQAPYGQQKYGVQNPYGQYPGGFPQQRGTNTLAIVALVLTFVFWPAGLICGFIARGQIKRSGEDGSGLALASIIVSSIFFALTVLYVIFIIVVIIAAAHSGGSTSGFSPSPAPTF